VFSYQKYDSKYLIPALEQHLGKENVTILPVPLSVETATLAAG